MRAFAASAAGATRWPIPFALGQRAGQMVLTLQGAMPRESGVSQALWADMQDFRLPAQCALPAGQPSSVGTTAPLHHPPGVANERARCSAAGLLVLKLKTAWRDGTPHLMMSPLEFMHPLASPLPTRGGPGSALFARRPQERAASP
jgi:hypothetical protein